MAYCTYYTETEHYTTDITVLTVDELNELVKFVVETKNENASIEVCYRKIRRPTRMWGGCRSETVQSSLAGGLGAHHFAHKNGEVHVTRGGPEGYYPLIGASLNLSLGYYTKMRCNPGESAPSNRIEPVKISLDEMKKKIKTAS